MRLSGNLSGLLRPARAGVSRAPRASLTPARGSVPAATSA